MSPVALFNKHAGLVATLYTLAQTGEVISQLGDEDQDGLRDIMVSTSPLSVFCYGSGGTTFAQTTATDITRKTRWLVSADVNHDNHADAVVTTNTGVNVGLGTSRRGVMALETMPTGHPAASLAVADFNNDGIADIAVLNSDTSASMVSLVAGY